jgi:hypothetical protein
MGKVKYDEYDDEMNPSHPCLACGGLEFNMDWDVGLYACEKCEEPVGQVKKMMKPRKKIKYFKELNGEDEIS